jgi:hypothetical protein
MFVCQSRGQIGWCELVMPAIVCTCGHCLHPLISGVTWTAVPSDPLSWLPAAMLWLMLSSCSSFVSPVHHHATGTCSAAVVSCKIGIVKPCWLYHFVLHHPVDEGLACALACGWRDSARWLHSLPLSGACDSSAQARPCLFKVSQTDCRGCWSFPGITSTSSRDAYTCNNTCTFTITAHRSPAHDVPRSDCGSCCAAC